MTAISTRAGLKTYCLRRLGAPVLEVNVDDDQVEDRIDDALQFFRQYHYDGTEKKFTPHTVTSSDITNKYIDASDPIIAITGIKLPATGSSGFSGGMFNEEYQFRLNDLGGIGQGGMTNYYLNMQYVSLVNDIMSPSGNTFHFNKSQNKLFIEIDWANDISAGDIILIENYSIVDPATYTEIWDDYFLKKYATSLIKKQWGDNLKKFEGVQMPGGITLNGQKIFDEAIDEIQKLEEDARNDWELPPTGLIG